MLHDQWVIKETREEIKKLKALNENDNSIYLNHGQEKRQCS
jgi:hypothetical protein